MTALALPALLAGCERRTELLPAPVTLATAPLVLAGSGPLAAPGPVHEVCLEVPEFAPSYGGTWTPGADSGAPLVTKSVPVTVQAAAVRTDGVREPLSEISERRGRAFEICFESSDDSIDERRVYRGVEVRASGPVRLLRATWWSGRRSKILW